MMFARKLGLLPFVLVGLLALRVTPAEGNDLSPRQTQDAVAQTVYALNDGTDYSDRFVVVTGKQRITDVERKRCRSTVDIVSTVTTDKYGGGAILTNIGFSSLVAIPKPGTRFDVISDIECSVDPGIRVLELAEIEQ